MATNETSVDLVIRAKDLSTKTFEELTGTLDRLTKGLDDLESQGGPAARTFRELETTAKDFAKVANELTARRGLAEQFVASGKAALEAKAGVLGAKEALAAYLATLEAGKRKTSDQTAQVNLLKQALKEQEAQLRSAEKLQASAVRQAQLQGMAIEDLVTNYDQLVAAEKRADAAAVQAEANARRRDQAVREAAAAKIEAARDAAAEQDRLSKLEQADAALQQRALKEQKALEESLAQSLRDQAEAEQQALARRERLRATGEALLEQKLREIAAQEKQQASLRELAADAEKAAAATGQLGAAGVDPAPMRKLAEEVRGIVEPAAKAQASLKEVEAALAGVEALQNKAAKGAALGQDELRKLAEGYQFLGQALKTVQGQAALVDSFRAQEAEAKKLEAELDAVRQRLLGYAEAARKADTEDAGLQKGIRDATAEALRLTKALEAAQASVGKYAQQLDAAGIDTNQLAKEQERLLGTANRLKGAYDAASDGQTKLGQTVAKANQEFKKGFELQRTSLSLYQRIRGQILSLTAAYVGLFGVISEAKAVLDSAVATQRLNTQLGVAFGGDPKVVAQELQYVSATAQKLGVDLKTLSASYGRFAISATAAGLSIADTRQVFESFTTTTRVFGLSADETAGVFKALEQSLGKGKVQAEELRGQIADRLPGAVNIFAKGLGVPIEQLDKLFEKGAIKAPAAIKLFANEYAKAIQGQVIPASVRFDAEIGRLQTNLFNFRNIVADSGFLEAMTKLAKGLSEFLKSAEGADLARDLGAAFSFLANTAGVVVIALRGVIDGFKSVLTAIGNVLTPVQDFVNELTGGVSGTVDWSVAVRGAGEAVAYLLTFLAVGKIVAWADALVVASRATYSMAAATTTLGVAVQRVLVPALVGLMAFEFGTWLYEQFDVVKKAGAALVGNAMIVVEALKGVARIANDSIVFIVTAGMSALVSSVTDRVQALGKFLAEAARKLGMTALADSLDRSLGQFGAGLEDSLKQSAENARKAVLASTKALTSGVTAEYAAMQDAFAQIDNETKRKAAAGVKSNRGALNAADAGLRGGAAGLSDPEVERLRKEALTASNDAAKAAKKARDELAALIKSTQAALDALSLRATKKEATELEGLLAAVDEQYSKLAENIRDISVRDPGRGAKMLASFEADKERVKEAIRAQQGLKDAQDQLTALQAQRDAKLDLVKAEAALDPGKRATLQADLNRISAEAAPVIAAQADKVSGLATALNRQLDAQKALITAAKERAAVSPEATAKAELEDTQRTISALTAERDARLALLDAKVEQGVTGGADADAERVALMTEYRDRLIEAATSARELALQLGDPITAANMDVLVQKFQTVDQKALEITNTLKGQLVEGLTDVGMAFGKYVGDALTDTEGAFVGLRETFKSFVRDFLTGIARMIIQQQALNAVQAISASFSGGASAGAGGGGMIGLLGSGAVPVAHSGWAVGSEPPPATRSAPAAWFANARRYHSGTMPGLKPDEVPAILQQGEQVLSRAQVAGMGQGSKQQDIKIINTIDPGEVASAGLGTQAGQRALINAMSLNRTTIKKVLG